MPAKALLTSFLLMRSFLPPSPARCDAKNTYTGLFTSAQDDNGLLQLIFANARISLSSMLLYFCHMSRVPNFSKN